MAPIRKERAIPPVRSLARAPRPAAGRGARPEFRTDEFLSISKQHFHRIAYTEWGYPESDRVAICVHGLSRQGRDFDCLARALAARGHRVVCPDLVGREGSKYGIEDYLSVKYTCVGGLDG